MMVNHLKEFTRVHGRVSVPDKYITADGAQLGWWARTQKSARNGISKNNHLTPQRIAQLDATGFVWGCGSNPECLSVRNPMAVMIEFSKFNQIFTLGQMMLIQGVDLMRCYVGDLIKIRALGHLT
eukprot:scaffold13731_cov51-Attheya_sp.AAC.4